MEWSGWVEKNERRVAVSGSRVISLDNLLVPASNRLPPALAPALHAFDLDALQPYDPRYLASFPAETFQISAAAASLDARRLALQTETRKVREGQFDQQVEDLQLRTNNMLVSGYRLALLPLWLMHYFSEGSEHRCDVAVNGQTGALTGERPERGLFGWVKDLF